MTFSFRLVTFERVPSQRQTEISRGWQHLSLALVLFLGSCTLPGLHRDETVPHVVFLTGDEEYRSEESMPMIAEILHRNYGVRVTICYAVDPETGMVNPDYLAGVEGLEALDDADLTVFFLRSRKFPDEQLEKVLEYVNSGRPSVGLRTSTHAFRYDGDDPRSRWNDEFGSAVFGQKWITHHGHHGTRPLTAVSLVKGKRGHPILRGVAPFDAHSWLYHVQGGEQRLQGDCDPLLNGHSLESNHMEELDLYPLENPVAWTKTYRGARVFFTTLGHPYDFREPAMRKLLVNGIFWALGLEDQIPAGGSNVDLMEGYAPSDAAFGGYKRGQKPSQVEQ